MLLGRRSCFQLAAGAAVFTAVPRLAAAADRIDATVEEFLAAFEIPGAALAIVQAGKAPDLRAYGVRKLGAAARVDRDTQFAIASNTKAYLAACLAMLVDAGNIGWDDPVVRHLPEFRMYDPAVTQMMTVRDLLVHRSGLPLGAGDLMQFPATDHTREDVLRALPHFRPATGFRAGYAYDNCLYIVAGLLLERVAGMSWDEFVTTRIFRPLGMRNAVSSTTLARGDNRAARHARLGPPVRGMGPVEIVPPTESAVIATAGGICMSVADSVGWLETQLGRGMRPNGPRLWSEAQAAEMWKGQTLMASGPGPSADMPQRSVLQAYALGWGVADYRGRRMIAHAGGLSGQVTRTTLLPDQGLGFVLYTNAEDGDALSALRFALLDILLDVPAHDWLAATRALKAAQRDEVTKLTGGGDFVAPAGGPSQPLEAYAGRYRDAWYGDVVVTRDAAGLAIDFTHTPAFKSRLEPFGPDSFRTRFARGAGEDAVVTFLLRDGKVERIATRALSPLADFSFDFHDLDLRPVQG